LQDLFDRWLSHAKLTKRSWPEDEAKWRYCFGRLKNRRLSEVTTADVATWHTKLGEERGTELANRARALLSAIYSKAHEMGYDGPNPCSGVARFPEQSRERYLRDDEIRPFFLAVKAEPAEWRDFWLLCLFTGARRGSVAAMEWREVDLKQAAWNLPASKTKNKKPAIIYLPPPAVAILETRQQDRNGKPYVFPSNSEAGHIKDPRKSWDRIITAAGLDDFHPHDLRRTLGSVQARLGASLQVIGASLGHRDHRSTEVYARLAEAPVQQSVQSAVAFLVDAGEPEQPAKKSSKGAAKTKGAKKSHARKGAKNGKAK
jgi:integrase